MSKITTTNTRTSLRSPFNSNRCNGNIPAGRHTVIKKKHDLKYFSRQAIRCEILAIMEPVDARKPTTDPVRKLGSSHYAMNGPETKFQETLINITPRPEMFPNSYCASFHVMSSFVICMTFLSLRYLVLEQMTQCIIHLRIRINNFWLALYASEIVSAMVSGYIICYQVMFAISTIFVLFSTHPSSFKGSNKHPWNELQGLVPLPHTPEANITTKQPKIARLENWERSCRLILEDILYTIDAQQMEGACIVIGIAVSWRVLYGFFFHVVHRFYSRKDRE